MNKQIAAKVIKTLQSAKEEVEQLLSAADDTNHRIRITHRLQMDIDHINLLNDVGVKSSQAATLGPATTIGGKKIVRKEKVSVDDVTPEEEKVKVLKKQVKDLYDSFLNTPNEEILKLDDTVVRGVAKKAGFNKVNKDFPEKITNEFIDEVKAAIKAKA